MSEESETFNLSTGVTSNLNRSGFTVTVNNNVDVSLTLLVFEICLFIR